MVILKSQYLLNATVKMLGCIHFPQLANIVFVPSQSVAGVNALTPQTSATNLASLYYHVHSEVYIRRCSFVK
ncbi:hypothetical protein E2542_SST31277 [Spatholobus suberectus]|nr:hypothetical protein E2542_SST31277 [Spatholobus suberectus]